MSGERSAMRCQIERVLGTARAALIRVLGVPDYESYVAHLAAVHPDRTPVTRETFMRERLDSRYTKPGAKCC